jgi:hypothetical protein
MTTSEIVTFLRNFNRWRRGNDLEQPDARTIGEMIDAACEHIERLEQEIYGWRNKWECAVELAALAEFELSKKTDTPETDNLARGNHVVPTEFAQDLERERNQWRECAAGLIYAIDSGDLNDRITARQDFDRLKGQTK